MKKSHKTQIMPYTEKQLVTKLTKLRSKPRTIKNYTKEITIIIRILHKRNEHNHHLSLLINGIYCALLK